MPRQISWTLSHCPAYHSCITRTIKHASNLAIGSHHAYGNTPYYVIHLGVEGVIHLAFSQIAARLERARESTRPFTYPVMVPSDLTTTMVGSPSMGISACLANFSALERNNTAPRLGSIRSQKLSASPLRMAPRTKKGAPSITEM